MNQQHPINEFTASAMQNLRSLVDVNTIIGDPISTADGTVIIPVSKVSFGFGSGGSDLPTKMTGSYFGGGTGGGVTIQPLAFLVIQGGRVELMQMQTANNTADRVVNTIPGLIDKVSDMLASHGKKEKGEKEEKPQR